MTIQVCRLCLHKKHLCDSHAIPNSFFKKIFRHSSGKAIQIVSNESTPIDYSNDSWSKALLCFECEQHISNTYEGKAIKILHGGLCSAQKSDFGVSLRDIDRSFGTSFLKLFFYSVLWRASLSAHSSYSSIILTPHVSEILRVSILEKKEVQENNLSLKIFRLIDRSKNGFTLEGLKEFIASPFTRKHPETNQTSFCFIFEGFFVEIFTPGFKYKYLNKPGVIRNKQYELHIPYVDIFSIPEFIEMAVYGYKKSIEGLSNITNNNRKSRTKGTE